MKLNVISFADSLIKILIVLIIDIPFIEVSLNELYYIPFILRVLRLRLRMLTPLRSARTFDCVLIDIIH